MDDKTIAALLALPDGAIVALFWTAGPGWEVWADKPPRLLDASDDGDEEPDGWLPCDPLEIVRVAGESNGARRLHISSMGPPSHSMGDDSAGKWWASLESYDDAYEATAYGDTPHIAALALLGKVWGG